MIKQVYKSVIILIVFLCVFSSNVFAYSDRLFEFDLPEMYVSNVSQDSYLFVNKDNENQGMIINKYKDLGLKKSVWDIEEKDFDKIITELNIGSNILYTDKTAKLGEEAAIKVVFEENGQYFEMYLLASDKYVYMISFVGISESDFDNENYNLIKNSFKIKDRRINIKLICLIILVVCIIIKILVTYIKQKKSNTETCNNCEIDKIEETEDKKTDK